MLIKEKEGELKGVKEEMFRLFYVYVGFFVKMEVEVVNWQGEIVKLNDEIMFLQEVSKKNVVVQFLLVFGLCNDMFVLKDEKVKFVFFYVWEVEDFKFVFRVYEDDFVDVYVEIICL